MKVGDEALTITTGAEEEEANNRDGGLAKTLEELKENRRWRTDDMIAEGTGGVDREASVRWRETESAMAK